MWDAHEVLTYDNSAAAFGPPSRYRNFAEALNQAGDAAFDAAEVRSRPVAGADDLAKTAFLNVDAEQKHAVLPDALWQEIAKQKCHPLYGTMLLAGNAVILTMHGEKSTITDLKNGRMPNYGDWRVMAISRTDRSTLFEVHLPDAPCAQRHVADPRWRCRRPVGGWPRGLHRWRGRAATLAGGRRGGGCARLAVGALRHRRSPHPIPLLVRGGYRHYEISADANCRRGEFHGAKDRRRGNSRAAGIHRASGNRQVPFHWQERQRRIDQVQTARSNRTPCRKHVGRHGVPVGKKRCAVARVVPGQREAPHLRHCRAGPQWQGADPAMGRTGNCAAAIFRHRRRRTTEFR